MRIIYISAVETFDFQLTDDGYGVSDVDMKIYIRRADSKWWNHATQDWDVSVIQNSMTEPDDVNLKGHYLYDGLPISKMVSGDRYNVRYYNTDAIYGLDQSETVGVMDDLDGYGLIISNINTNTEAANIQAACAAAIVADTGLAEMLAILGYRLEISILDSKAYVWKEDGSTRLYQRTLTDIDNLPITATTKGPINGSKWIPYP
jgi:hypothetical protein